MTSLDLLRILRLVRGSAYEIASRIDILPMSYMTRLGRMVQHRIIIIHVLNALTRLGIMVLEAQYHLVGWVHFSAKLILLSRYVE